MFDCRLQFKRPAATLPPAGLAGEPHKREIAIVCAVALLAIVLANLLGRSELPMVDADFGVTFKGVE